VASGGRRATRTPALTRPSRFKRAPAGPAGSPSIKRRAGDSNASAVRRPAAFGAVPAPWQVHSPLRKTEKSNLSARGRPHGFQPRPGPCPVHLPSRRAEQSKPMPGGTHSLAARPDP